MSNLNFNEIGQVIRVQLGQDLTLVSPLPTPTLLLQPENGETKEITAGVTIPTSSVTVGNETFEAYEYIEYTTIAKDLDYVGRWKKKYMLEFTTANIEQGDYEKFRVLP